MTAAGLRLHADDATSDDDTPRLELLSYDLLMSHGPAPLTHHLNATLERVG